MPTALGLSESATRQVVAAAGMAPSLFNTQPWRFRLCPDRIEVHADLGRRLIGHDPRTGNCGSPAVLHYSTSGWRCTPTVSPQW